MAVYKYVQCLTMDFDFKFDREYSSGGWPDHSGIYRCFGCGEEVVCEVGRPLPLFHREHEPDQGPVRWKLLVAPQQKKPESAPVPPTPEEKAP